MPAVEPVALANITPWRIDGIKPSGELPSNFSPETKSPGGSPSPHAAGAGAWEAPPFEIDDELNSIVALHLCVSWHVDTDVAVVAWDAYTAMRQSGSSADSLVQHYPSIVKALQGGSQGKDDTLIPDVPCAQIVHITYNTAQVLNAPPAARSNTVHLACRQALSRSTYDSATKTISYDCHVPEGLCDGGDAAMHILLRTIRRFLERHRGAFDRLVLCVTDWDQVDAMRAGLRWYFPRNAEDLQESMEQLHPDDLGGPDGEVRVPAPESEGGSPILSQDRTSSFLPMHEDTSPTGRDIGGDMPLEAESSQEARFRRLVVHPQRFHASSVYGPAVKRCDVGTLPVIVVAMCELPEQPHWGLLQLHVVQVLAEVHADDLPHVHVVVFNKPGKSRPSIRWVRDTHAVVPKVLRKRIQAVSIVNPGPWATFVIGCCKVFVSAKFWKKVKTTSLADVERQYPGLPVPSAVLRAQ